MAAPASAAASAANADVKAAAERLDVRIEEVREKIRMINCLVACSLHDHPDLANNVEKKTLDSLMAISEKVVAIWSDMQTRPSAGASDASETRKDLHAAKYADVLVKDVCGRVRWLYEGLQKNLPVHPNIPSQVDQKTRDMLDEMCEKIAHVRDTVRSGGKRKTTCVKDEKISDDDDEPLAKRRCLSRAAAATSAAVAASAATAVNAVRAPVRGRRPAAAAAATSEIESSDSDDDLVDSDCDDIEQMLSLGEPCDTCTKLVTADGARGTDRGDRCGHCINAALCDSDACRNKHWASPECQKAARKSMTERRRMRLVDQAPDVLLFKPECAVCHRAGYGAYEYHHGYKRQGSERRIAFQVCQICNWSRVCGSLDCMESHKDCCARKYPQRAELVKADRRARHRAAAAASEAAAAAASVTTAVGAAL